MKRILTVTALAALVMTACSKDESAATATPGSIVIDPTVIEMPKTQAGTRAVTRATDVDFEDNDAIGLTITMAGDNSKYADNARFVYATDKFVSADNLLWYTDVGLKSNLVAYHPYAATVPTEFTVKADQTGTGYTLSDLMIAAKEDVVPSVGATNMTFYHKLTKLVINTDNQTGGDITSVVVRGTIPTATVDIPTQEVALKAGESAADIKAHVKTANTQYYAIIVPQTVAVQLAVTIKNGSTEKTLSQTYSKMELVKGKYTINVRVLPDKLDVTISGDIEDWGDNGEIKPGEGPSFEEFDDHFVYDGESYRIATLKDGRKWMTENMRYVPQGKAVEEDFTKEGDGIWYPVVPKYDDGSAKYVGAVSKDATAIRSNGYLYAFAAVMNVPQITEDNSATFEGKQGICPKGWHVPSAAEWTSLVNAYPLADSPGKADLAALTADGFACTLTGMRQKNTSATAGAVSGACYQDHLMAGYMMSSTKNSYSVNSGTGAITTQNKVLMLMSNASNANASVSNTSNLGGVPMRCIKDSAN